MGVSFNDPDIEDSDVIWYNIVATEMYKSIIQNEGLISVNDELETASCYVELHRKSLIDLFYMLFEIF